MNTKQKIKLYFLAAVLGAGLAFEISRPPTVTKVNAEEMVMVSAAVLSPTVTSTPTATPTPVPVYRLENIINHFSLTGVQLEYANYIWDKWQPHGNRLQAVAICTNVGEGHFDDAATNDNGPEGVDRGCWQWNSKYHPEITDEMARNCKTATDITYATWKNRYFNLGLGEGFYPMWYGGASKNFYKCMDIITN